MCCRPSRPRCPRPAGWVASVLGDAGRRDELGRKARALAEREFALDRCANRFEEILGRAAGVATVTHLDIRDDSPLVETFGWVAPAGHPYSRSVFTTWLTKRRAVDHCRVRSSLCRLS